MSEAQLRQAVGPEDHVQGPDDAPVTLVQYGDFECPYCGAAYPIVKSVQVRLGTRLRFVFRHFPMREQHPNAETAAEISEAAAAQGRFWPMHDVLYEHQDALEPPDLLEYAVQLGLDVDRVERELQGGEWRRRVREDFRSGVRSGVNGTPTFFINGERFDGNWTNDDELTRALRAAMETGASPSRR